ncbi:MAG: M20/M25/M40 family metallo-hydrolase, partial [Tannerella sp.]|nr:M20/M25/M40 family metallo-hydrolase [Tannerella sp.]
MNDLYDSCTGLLKAMIAIPSHSREERAVADMLEKYMSVRGLNPLRRGNNLWCVAPGFREGAPVVLLNSHIDTVKPVPGWQYDPYMPVEVGNRIYGLGSNDAGGSVVSLLHAFISLSEKRQAYNLIFLASAE